jgi:L-asparaginase
LKIYVLYTGGTIGSVGQPLAPLPGPAFVKAFRENVEGIVTSQVPGTALEYDYFEHTLDSTNMQPSDWVRIAQRIVQHYEANDAFLILHGTDTMAWTSSALSFLLPGISKPLFVTGSQLPLFYQSGGDTTLLYNTDALRNVLGAIGFMGFAIPEVALYFADTLYRGNRVVKSNASQFTAFSSPNYPALGTYGVVPRVDDRLLLPTPSSNALDKRIPDVAKDLETVASHVDASSVIQLLTFPAYYDAHSGRSLLVSMLTQLAQVSPPLAGIVFESFGEGNLPDFDQLKALLAKLHQGGVVLVDCTQVYAGDVNYNAYATGAWLKKCGVISGYDMTPIAALAKLIVLRALRPSAPQGQIETAMGTDLAGEMESYYSLSGYQNEFLAPGESLYSINGSYQFVNEGDGELVLYDVRGEQAARVWSRACGARGRLVMQSDSNLVFYDKDFNPLFSSGTQRIGGNATFRVNDDGTLCIYDLYSGALIQRLH